MPTARGKEQWDSHVVAVDMMKSGSGLNYSVMSNPYGCQDERQGKC